MSGAERFRQLLTRMGTRASFVRLVAVSVLIVITFSILKPSVFLTNQNFQYVELISPEVGLLSLAIAVTMLTAGIDLSVVAIANLSAIAGALVMTHGGGVGLGIVVAFATALACGVVNGVLVGFVRVPPILATLGTSQLFGGIALVASDGTVVKGLPTSFTDLALQTVLGIPLIFVVFLLVAVVIGVVISTTALGTRMRLVGANPTAADFSGIRRPWVLLQTYVISSALAGIAGLIIAARATGANSDYGTSYVLLGIVIAVLAGVDPDGGYLTVAGVVIAAIALQLLSSGLLAMNASTHVINIAQGCLLIVMVLLNTRGDALWQGFKQRRALATEGAA